MNYEWDDDKNETNIMHHGIDFQDACEIFNQPMLEKEDTRKNYGEVRCIGIGLIDNVEVVVIYTYRGQAIRIISVRRANKNERKIYQDTFAKQD